MKALDYDGLDYVVDKIYDVVNSGGSADYIVEEGTSGIWTYRKWASGVSECWGIYEATLTYYGIPWEGSRAFYSSVSFPAGLFVAMPTMTSDFRSDNQLAFSCGGLHTLSATGTNVYGITVGGSNTQSCRWTIQVIGRWKEFTPTAVSSNYSPAADYVVEKGTSGSWSYQKWASGFAECWADLAFSSTTSTSVNLAGNIPTGIMNTTTQKDIFVSGSFTGIVDSHVGYARCSNAGYYDVYLIRSSTSNVAGSIKVLIKGRWK